MCYGPRANARKNTRKKKGWKTSSRPKGTKGKGERAGGMLRARARRAQKKNNWPSTYRESEQERVQKKSRDKLAGRKKKEGPSSSRAGCVGSMAGLRAFFFLLPLHHRAPLGPGRPDEGAFKGRADARRRSFAPLSFPFIPLGACPACGRPSGEEGGVPVRPFCRRVAHIFCSFLVILKKATSARAGLLWCDWPI